jgi:hypothetical protein
MAVTPDQLATLQLLLVRGQSYADLAKVLGLDEAAVRERARGALAELGGGVDPDRNVGLTDYLLGQADPIGRADASRHLRDHADDHALATRLSEQLRSLYPTAELPRLPGEARRPRTPRRAQPAGSAGGGVAGRLSGLSQSQTRLMVGLASAAVLLVVVVLAVTGAFSGGSDDEPSAAADETSTTADTEGEQAVPIELSPVGNSDAGGVVVFGFATADQPFIEFQVRNLEPATNDTAYVLWFLSDARRGFPLPTPLPVQANGTLNQRIPVPAEILGFVQQARTVTIALNDRKQLDRDITQAVNQGSGAIPFPGGSVLSAQIGGAGGGGAAGGGGGGGQSGGSTGGGSGAGGSGAN